MAANTNDLSLQDAEESPPPLFASLSTLGVVVTDELPSTVAGFQKFRFHQTQAQRDPASFIGFLTQRLVRNRKELEVEFPGAQQAVFNVILAIKKLLKLDSFSHSDKEKLHIDYLLTTIMGQNRLARGPYSFPVSLQSDASTVLKAVNERLPAKEDVSSGGNSSTSAPHRRAHKRRRTNNPQQQPLASISSQTINSVLHGIIDVGTGKRSYRLADKDSARNCNVVGDNGIAVGTWWPYRICALRDGAHGATIAGIAGSIDDGAYSIVVSGKSDVNMFDHIAWLTRTRHVCGLR